MKRRDPLTTVATAALLGLDPAYPAAREKEAAGKPLDAPISRRQYGRTDEQLSVIGFGGMVVQDLSPTEAKRFVAYAVVPDGDWLAIQRRNYRLPLPSWSAQKCADRAALQFIAQNGAREPFGRHCAVLRFIGGVEFGTKMAVTLARAGALVPLNANEQNLIRQIARKSDPLFPLHE